MGIWKGHSQFPASVNFLYRFDLKEFHKAVLQNGSLPLDLLTDQVDEYIRNAKASGK